MRFDKGATRGNTAGNDYGSGSKATTQKALDGKGPNIGGKRHQGYDRFEDSGFLIPNSQEHQSVFEEGHGTGTGTGTGQTINGINGQSRQKRGLGGHNQGGGTSSQQVTPMKTTGLYKDPTMNNSQKSDQTMRSALIKDRKGADVNMDGASVSVSASANASIRGGGGGLGGFLGGLSGTGTVHMQNGAFQI